MNRPTAILMGSKPGSIVVLGILLERGWQVQTVVVSPKAEHPWETDSLHAAAERHRIPVVTMQAELPPHPIDFVISYMFRYRVTAATRALARRGAVNFHAGPLPEFGGWAFYSVAILEDSAEYGCSCHFMDDGFDSGPLLRVRRFPIDASRETACSLEQRTQEEMIRLFIDFATLAESGEPLPRQEQKPDRRRYLTRAQFQALKRIPPGSDDETVQRYARAFWYPPYDCAYLEAGAVRVEVVPRIIKDQLARQIHAEELERLQHVAREDDRARRPAA